MKASTVFKKARAILSDPKRWTKGHFARFANGEAVYTRDDSWNAPEAVSFCALGATYYARKKPAFADSPEAELLHLLTGSSGLPFAAAEFNDSPTTTHEDVLTLFDWAIGIAEAEEELEGVK